MKKKISSTLLVLALGLFISGQVQAATTTATLDVSATVGVTCEVLTSPVNFGAYSGIQMQITTGTITVTCSPDVPYTIALDAGQNHDGDTRRLSNGTDLIRYELGQNLSPNPVVWGDDGVTNNGIAVAGIGVGFAQAHVVYAGLELLGYTPSDGIYTDVVGVTVHY
jgi:spore coat protein U-like protein